MDTPKDVCGVPLVFINSEGSTVCSLGGKVTIILDLTVQGGEHISGPTPSPSSSVLFFGRLIVLLVVM